MAGTRKAIPAATQAALWALSSGRCYAPDCPVPVVVEIRMGVYRKNAQIGHIYGVKPGAARFDPAIPDEIRDAFTNLLLLCLPHHGEVDDKKTGERMYSPDLLRTWKTTHEGSDGPALAGLGRVDEESIGELLAAAFTPPIERLEELADQLERTGTLTAESLAELRQVVHVLRDSPGGPDWRTAQALGQAAEVFGTRSFTEAAGQLRSAADVIDMRSLAGVAESLEQSVNWLRRNRGGFGPQ